MNVQIDGDLGIFQFREERFLRRNMGLLHVQFKMK